MKSTFLGKTSTEEFMKKYWNKKPVLIKNAVRDISKFADFEDFMEMAQDGEFETRIVYEKGGDYPWQAKVGPFKKKDFKSKALWTLICHNLELINSDFFKLKQNVSFIPEWHFDDIMATISKKDASVGAHIDDYSVFIIQGKGRRKWLLEENPNHEYFPDLDIRLLTHFNPKIEWVLEPGDMVYIPPNVAHHGISLEDSISYSLGFKSVRYKDLLDVYVTNIMAELEESSFHDPKMGIQKDRFILENYVVDQVHCELMTLMKNETHFKEAFLSYLSRPKNEVAKNEELNADTIIDNLQMGMSLKRDIWAKLVAVHSGLENYDISVCGNSFNVKSATYKKLNSLFNQEAETIFILNKRDLTNKEFRDLMIMFIQNGVFYFSEDQI